MKSYPANITITRHASLFVLKLKKGNHFINTLLSANGTIPFYTGKKMTWIILITKTYTQINMESDLNQLFEIVCIVIHTDRGILLPTI